MGNLTEGLDETFAVIGLPVVVTLTNGLLLVDVDLSDITDALSKDSDVEGEDIALFEEALANRNVFLRYTGYGPAYQAPEAEAENARSAEPHDPLLQTLRHVLPDHEVQPSNGPEPTEFYIVIPGTGIPGEPGTEHMICLARDFNRPGFWEAALDKNGDQEGLLPDGPASDASPAGIALWALHLINANHLTPHEET